jgi:hypothetical protein
MRERPTHPKQAGIYSFITCCKNEHAYFAEQADGEVLQQLMLKDKRLFQLLVTAARQ